MRKGTHRLKKQSGWKPKTRFHILSGKRVSGSLTAWPSWSAPGSWRFQSSWLPLAFDSVQACALARVSELVLANATAPAFDSVRVCALARVFDSALAYVKALVSESVQAHVSALACGSVQVSGSVQAHVSALARESVPVCGRVQSAWAAPVCETGQRHALAPRCRPARASRPPLAFELAQPFAAV